MGFLLKALGVGLAVAGVKKIKHNIEEENRREVIKINKIISY